MMDPQVEQWIRRLEDPFKRQCLLVGDDLPQAVAACAEPVQGEPAFDPGAIDRSAAEIALPDVRFENPLLERVVRVGLAHVDATFRGDHPKYGVGDYARDRHDTFPPTIVAAVDALTLWSNVTRAEELFSYWLANFVGPDGAIAYEGPSLSEYGQLLTTGRRLTERGASEGWLRSNEAPLGRLARRLLDMLAGGGGVRLLAGVPEDDERDRPPATYFHNNAWVVRGLMDFSVLLKDRLGRCDEAARVEEIAGELQRRLLEAIDETWPRDADDWWLPPVTEVQRDDLGRPEGRVTANRFGGYTNYRYWPELLSSGVLPRELMQRIVKARLSGGGQFCGTTRFNGTDDSENDRLDDWPLMEYISGLRSLGMHDDARLCLWGHIHYHQAKGHLTAYEQVTFPPGRKVADYCLPCQLVAVRAAGYTLNPQHDATR